MSRYIDADDLLAKYGEKHFNGGISSEEYYAIKIPLDYAQTEDVVDVVHGEWVKDEEKSKKLTESIFICSVCHNFEAWGETEKYNYCPNCGARMDGKI